MIDKKILKEEKQYLNDVEKIIANNLEINKIRQEEENENFEELMEHYSLEIKHIDDEEKASIVQMLGQSKSNSYALEKLQTRLLKQKNSPYFGRFDFQEKNEKDINKFYIGINNLTKDGDFYPVVFDWRAPISSMYYDYEKGEASYIAPDGKIEGEILTKRQYKIQNGVIIFCFDAKERIGDDILQEALSQTTDIKMSQIASTIQKEQNKIIREDLGTSILVQGVAGSGKTSVALHRVAYLLYQNRDKLTASDILIISPNRIFSEYIGNVLPELGEENLEQITFEEIADEELTEFVGKLETRAEMLENTLLKHEKRNEEINIKNSFNFYEKFKAFLEHHLTENFVAKDIKMGEKTIKKETIEDLYKNRYKSKIPALRIAWITDYISDLLGFENESEAINKRIKRVLYPMFSSIKLEDIYSQFLSSQNMTFEKENGKIRYEDISPLLFIKNYLIGIDCRSNYKYLLIDEMQDYSPITFEIFSCMYPCNKTVLGDINQSVEKILEKDYIEKLNKMLETKLITLKKCYRSSMQITEYAKTKMPEIEMQSFARNGKDLEFYKFKTDLEKVVCAQNLLLQNGEYNKIAIITTTQKEAENLYHELEDLKDLSLISSGSQEQTKFMIMPVGLSKGLEFDMVIAYDMQEKTPLQKQLKFIAITRALHSYAEIN